MRTAPASPYTDLCKLVPHADPHSLCRVQALPWWLSRSEQADVSAGLAKGHGKESLMGESETNHKSQQMKRVETHRDEWIVLLAGDVWWIGGPQVKTSWQTR